MAFLCRVEAEVFDAGVGEFVGEFEFLSVEDGDVFQFAAIGEFDIDALIAHPRLRQPEQAVNPTFL